MPDIRSITLRNFKGAEEVTIDISKRINSPVVTLIGLGSGLIDYNQKMTMAAMQIADMNV